MKNDDKVCLVEDSQGTLRHTRNGIQVATLRGQNRNYKNRQGERETVLFVLLPGGLAELCANYLGKAD